MSIEFKQVIDLPRLHHSKASIIKSAPTSYFCSSQDQRLKTMGFNCCSHLFTSLNSRALQIHRLLIFSIYQISCLNSSMIFLTLSVLPHSEIFLASCLFSGFRISTVWLLPRIPGFPESTTFPGLWDFPVSMTFPGLWDFLDSATFLGFQDSPRFDFSRII